MEGLGALGFWLAVGMVLAAGAIAGGRKEVEKEREKQATLRTMLELEAEGKLTPETLAFMREKDAAERYLAREALGLTLFDGLGPRGVLAGVAAFLVGLISMMAGIGVTARLMNFGGAAWYVAIPVMLGVWVVGLLIAAVLFRVIRGRKNAPPPGA